jgi:gamma-glutamyltranspeptidase/glutathione hydrolase
LHPNLRLLASASAATLLLAQPALAKAPQHRPVATQPITVAPAQGDAKAGTAAHVMVAAANPLAVQTGLRILQAGGSAVDAAVAVQAVLGLVEPESSGLGGGAFLLFYEAKTRKVTAYDGREVAPKGADPKQFIGPDGKPLTYFQAVTGGIASGVPGAIAMLELAQKEHGKLKWSALFGEARKLANEGFEVTPKLGRAIVSAAPQAKGADAQAYFFKPDGTPYKAGEHIINKPYAATLDKIAAQGAKAILTGELAEKIVAKLHGGTYPSTMTLEDMAAYSPKKTQGLCLPYRAHVVCTPQAPSGGVAVQEALGLLARTDINKRGPQDPVAWLQFAQASRLAYADRDRYEGDPAFVPFPKGLLAPDYLAQRAKLIGDSIQPVTYGMPKDAPKVGPDATKEPGGTSHFVIVDAAGNVVSMTTTVESIFGNGRMVDGFFLNNQLTDFSFTPTEGDGTPAANAVAGGKRPRSSMSPTIVLSPKGDFEIGVGSPGGSAIIAYDLKTLVAMLDWGMAPQSAASLPNLVARGDSFGADPFPQDITAALATKGLVLQTARGENSGIHVVLRRSAKQGGGYSGAADPRREGVARGF